MPRKFPIYGFTGLNEVSDPTNLRPTDWMASLDMRILDDTSAMERTGNTKELTTKESTKILDIEQIEVGVSRHNIFCTKSDLKHLVSKVATSVLSNLNGSDYGRFHQWNDELYFTNGVDNIKKVKIKEKNYIYDSDSSYIYKKDWDGNILQTIESTADFVYSDGTYLYATDQSADTIAVYTLDMVQLASYDTKTDMGTTFYGPRQMTSIGTFLYIEAYDNATNNSASIKLYKILKSTMVVDSSVALTIWGSVAEGACLCSNATQIVFTTLISAAGYRAYEINTSLSISGTTKGFSSSSPVYVPTNIIDDDFYYLYKTNTTPKQITKLDMTDFTTLTDVELEAAAGYPTDNGTPSASGSNSIIRGIVTDSHLVSTEAAVNGGRDGHLTFRLKSDMSLVKRMGGTSGLTIVPSTGININDWHDLVSPYKPTPVLDETGSENITATCTYRTTWCGYDWQENDVVLYESSGGLQSSSIVATTDKINVYFPTGSEFLPREKAEYLGITHHRLYRKEGSNQFLLQGTYPVYFILDGKMASGDLTFVVDDLKDCPSAENIWVMVNDEIMEVTTITAATRTLTVSRGVKGTNARIHIDDSVVYVLGVVDNVLTANLGVPPPSCQFIRPGEQVRHHL